MSAKRIKVGDKVNIYFGHAKAEFNIMITYTPVASGDSWFGIREDGSLVAVGNFEKMEQLIDED